MIIILLREYHIWEPARRFMSKQITGSEAVLAALDNSEDIQLVLMDRKNRNEEICNICVKRGITLEEGSANDLKRMSLDGTSDVLALIGREPEGTLEEVFNRPGAIWLFDGVSYATNIGFAIRTAEVSGATAVLLNVEKTHSERRTVRRSAMRADRFIPVIYAKTEEILKANNRRIIAAEDIGDKTPWQTDLTGDVLLVVGAEMEGVSSEVLSVADEVVRLPMDGFVPSYNLQVAVSALAMERLRQSE